MIEKLKHPRFIFDQFATSRDDKINELVDVLNTLTDPPKPCHPECSSVKPSTPEVKKPRTKKEIVDSIAISSITKKEMVELFREYALSCLPKEVAVDPDNEYFLRGYNAAIEEMRRRILM